MQPVCNKTSFFPGPAGLKGGLLVILLFFCIRLSAQVPFLIQGRVIDQAGTGLPGASVILTGRDSTMTITGKDGRFTCNRVLIRRFTLTVSAIGYETYSRNYDITDSVSVFRIEPVKLLPFFKTLEEVMLRSPRILIREDTIEFKADSFGVRPGDMAEDLLKKLPGIYTSPNGTIMVQGKLVTRIKVNGKDFFGNNTRAASELPADIIDRVQVIDDYGEMAAVSGIKTGQPQKIINVQLKKNRSKGVFGKAEAGYGHPDVYRISGNASLFREKTQLTVSVNANNIGNTLQQTSISRGAGISGMAGSAVQGNGSGQMIAPSNGSEGRAEAKNANASFRADFGKRNSFYGNLGITDRNLDGNREILQRLFYPTAAYTNQQKYFFHNRGRNGSAIFNLELFPDSLSFLKISASVTESRNNNFSRNQFQVLRDNALLTRDGYTLDTGRSHSSLQGIMILYNRRFSKKGRNLALDISGNKGAYSFSNLAPSYARVLENTGTWYESEQWLNSRRNNRNRDYHLHLIYTEPLGNSGFIDLNWYHQRSGSDHQGKTYFRNPVSGNDSLLAAYSSQYDTRFINDRFGASYRQVKKKYNYTVGLNLNPAKQESSSLQKDSMVSPRSPLNFSPQARFTGNVSTNSSLTLAYNGNSRQPPNWLLQPVREITDPQVQREGNPALKPEFAHLVSVSYNSFGIRSGNSFFSSISFATIRNRIQLHSFLLDNSGVQLVRPENINGTSSISGNYNYTIYATNHKMNLSLDGAIMMMRNPFRADNLKITSREQYFMQGLSIAYTGTGRFEWNAGLVYEYGVTRNQFRESGRTSFSAWKISQEARLELPGKLILKYNSDCFFTKRLSGSQNRQLFFLNAMIEKRILKKNNLYCSFSGYNLLNEGRSMNRQVTSNSITDISIQQLRRYFLLSLLYRWNRF